MKKVSKSQDIQQAKPFTATDEVKSVYPYMQLGLGLDDVYMYRFLIKIPNVV